MAGRTDLQWSLGADWEEFRRGILDAQKFGSQAMGNLTTSAMRAASVFGQPFRARNSEFAIINLTQYARKVALTALAISTSMSIVFRRIPTMAINAAEKLPSIFWKQFLKITLLAERTFPKLFNKVLSHFPLLENIIRKGPSSAGVYFRNMFSKLPNGLQRFLRSNTEEVKRLGASFIKLGKSVSHFLIHTKRVRDAMGRIHTEFRGLIPSILNVGLAFVKLGTVIGALFGVVGGILAGLVAHFLGVGKELDDLSRTSGYTGKQIMQLQLMMIRLGYSSQEANDQLIEMRGKLYEASTGFGSAAQWAAILGLNVGELIRMNPAASFETIATAVNNLGNDYQRNAAAVALLGSKGAEAASNFQSLAETNQLFLPFIQRIDAAKAEMAGVIVAWRKLKEGASLFFEVVSGRIAPVLRPLLEALLPLLPKIASIAEKFGDAIASGIRILYNAFENDSLWSLIEDGFIAVMLTVGNYLAYVVRSILPVLVWVFKKAMEVLWIGMTGAAKFTAAILAHPLKFQEYKTTAAIRANSEAEFAKRARDAATRAMVVGDIDEARFQSKQAAEHQSAGEEAARQSETGEGFEGNWFEMAAGNFEDAISEMVKRIKEGATDITGSAEAWNKVLLDAMQLDKKLPGEGQGLPETPGDKGGGVRGYPMFLNVFDELRKIGGGLGKQAVGTTDKALEYQRQTAENTRFLKGLKGFGNGSLAGNRGGFGIWNTVTGVAMAGA